MKEALSALIRDQLKTYRETRARMISDYYRERQLMGEYNGRQILEMLQNADDEESETVLIRLDEHQSRLTIANHGVPFSLAGIQSLMLANMSSKTKVKYIGNKGLGFRSLVNWAHRVTIDSGPVSVTFSEAIARRTFEQLFDEETRRQIRQERNFGAEAVPLAFLAVPEFADRAASEWTTEIAIDYRPAFLDGIKAQLASLQPECLLFLNHIHTVIIEHDGERRTLHRKLDGATVVLGADRWQLHEDEAPLPDDYQNADKAEEEWYSLKLATTDGLSKGARVLYTFFPTQVSLDLPMVVHGTFDLDSSRNQLIQSPRNEFLLTRLVNLIISTARALKDGATDPWIQVRLLHYRNANEVLGALGFYRQLDQALSDLAVFPCVDGQYRKACDVYYLGDAFSELVLMAGCGALFPALAYPGVENADYTARYQTFSTSPTFVDAVNELSARLLGHELAHRVDLISILCAEPALAGKYALLVNEQGMLIDADTDAYTPRTGGDTEVSLPPFVNIDFMSQPLFAALAARLGVLSSDKAREVQRALKSVTTVHSYEPAQIIRSIIRAATVELRQPRVEAPEIIGVMVAAMLENFTSGDPASLPPDTSVPLLNTDLDVVDARELFLSGVYPTGAHTERLFAKVHRPDRFLAPPSEFGGKVAAADPVLLERVFAWLGVNRFVRYMPVRDAAGLQRYGRHVLDLMGRPPSYREHKVECMSIPDADLVKMLAMMPREDLVEWLIRDGVARARLSLDNPDRFDYAQVNERGGTYQHALSRKPSYLHFQLKAAGLFDHFVLNRDLPAAELINPFVFDFAAPGLAAADITRRDIEAVLASLGAKEQFEDLPPEAVAAVLRKLPDADPKGRRTQRIYRLVRQHYAVHKLALPADVPLFAYRGEHGAYFPQDQVYYSDNIRLPRKVVSSYAMLDYPRRGGAAVIPACFGVNSLNDLALEVDSYAALTALTQALTATLREKLPFILAYRIQPLKNGQANEAARLNRLKLILCAELHCRVDGASLSLGLNDYVRDGTTYLIKVDPTASLADLERDPHFCDTFADIVAAVFTVGEHWAEFRGVFKDPLSEVQHLARNALGDDTLHDARQLLGMASPTDVFWSAVWAARSGGAVGSFTREACAALWCELGEYGIEAADLDVERLVAAPDTALLKRIFDALQVQPSAFNQVALDKLDFADYHRRGLTDMLHAAFETFAYSAWRRLDGQDWPERARFLDTLAAFEDTRWIAVAAGRHREDLAPDYEALLADHVKSFGLDALALVPAQDYEQHYRAQHGAYTADELASLPATARSMLFFEGGLAHLRAQGAERAAGPERTSPTPAVTEKPLPATNAIPMAPSGSRGGGTRPPGSSRFNPDHDARNRATGAHAERIVFASLVKKYGKRFVEHVAELRDGDGYDIRYSPDQGRSWRYAEVKRYTHNRIHLSSNEYAFARANRGTYELFLVNASDEISTLADIDFSDATKFDIVASEFVVSFSLHGAAAEASSTPDETDEVLVA